MYSTTKAPGWTTKKSGFDFRKRQDFSRLHGIQKGFWAHPPSGDSTRQVKRWEIKQTAHLHLEPRFRMCGVTPPFSPTSSWSCA